MTIPPALDPALWPLAGLAALALAGLALLAAGLLALRLRRASRRLGALEAHYALVMRGADGGDLAAALEAHARHQAAGERRLEALEARVTDLDGRLRHAVTGVRLLRYRAFEDGGGDQSFALALLDEAADGAVLSGIHGRGGIRVYAKPVVAGQSSYHLTAEEARVIAEAGAGRGG